MRNIYFFILLTLCKSTFVFTQTIKIGTQIWMTQNLNVDKFRNGDLIPQAKTTADWIKADLNGKPAWCYFHNDDANGNKFGKLYNWYAVNDPRGLAPTGWIVPLDDDWTKLTDYLGGEDIAGTRMKSKSGWDENGNGTNSSGFSGLPGGWRNYSGTFSSSDNYGRWWSSTETRHNNARDRTLNCYDGSVSSGISIKGGDGLSVRCLKK